MKIVVVVVFLIVVVGLVLYYTPGSGRQPAGTYAGGLAAVKRLHQNSHWPSGSGRQVVAVLDTLISDLVAAGEKAPEEEKLACFRRSDVALHEIYRNKRPIAPRELEQIQRTANMAAIVALGLDKYNATGSSPLTIGRE